MVPWSSMNPLSKWVRKSCEREGTRQVKGYVDALDIHLVSSVQSLSRVRLFATPWTTAHQASLSITTSWSPPKPMSIELVMPSNHLILCHPLLLLPFFKKKLYQLLCFEEKEQEQTIYFSLLPMVMIYILIFFTKHQNIHIIEYFILWNSISNNSILAVSHIHHNYYFESCKIFCLANVLQFTSLFSLFLLLNI